MFTASPLLDPTLYVHPSVEPPARATIEVYLFLAIFLSERRGSLTQNRRKIRPLNFCMMILVVCLRQMGVFIHRYIHVFNFSKSVFGVWRSPSTVASPPTFLYNKRNSRFQNQLPRSSSSEIRCPSTPRRRLSIDLCTQEN